MSEQLDVIEPQPAKDPETTPAPPPPEWAPFWERREAKIGVVTAIVLLGICTFLFGFFYIKFARLIDRRLAGGAFSDTIDIFTAPRTVAVGDALSVEDVVARLRHSGYSTARGNPMGWYNVRPRAVEIFPGKDSYTGGDPGMLQFSGGKISRIVSLQDNTERKEYVLEPQLIANLSEHREKRRLVRFPDIPQPLIHAVISAEDKRFFQHSGLDMFRVLKAAYVDMKEGRKEQGASTLTMQLARGFFLDSDKRWKRKLAEIVMTLHLEDKLTKQQIFEDYANQVYLGRRGTFSINGFGEAAHAYFGKDLSQLTIAEAALLAGMVQRPSYYNPLRYPERAKTRRDLVLSLMRQNGYLSDADYQAAIDTPVKVSPEQFEGIESQYFVDLMNDEMQNKFEEHDSHTRYIYTTLDPGLQRAAEEAVNSGMQLVDQELRKNKKHAPIPAHQPQVALIALDPHTGEIKALVGGRNYATSQLNHVLAMRQPGSAFKPFVYAAAIDSGIEGGRKIFTPASVVDDSPTTFSYGNRTYQPSNFKHQFLGSVTLRTALAHSLNVATVQVAQQVGYDRVVAMARRVGLNDEIKATPAVALGAYETTPLEIAGAYTVFANQGMLVKPTTLALVRSQDGTAIYSHSPESRSALDPRVAYLMVNMMQDVLRYGTGASVRSRGFTLPAAGKTGTSRDGWFAGFTSELLCVVWVGFDDGRELNLEGAHSALPVWAEFMKRAAQFRQYRDAKPFQQPSGIVSVKICADSGQLAGEFCPDVRSDVFINGTQPAVECEMHALGAQQYADRVIEDGGAPVSATTGRETVAPAQRQIIVLPRPSSPTTERQTVPPPPPVQAPASGRQTIPPAPPATNRRPTTPPALPPGAPPTALPGRGQ